MEDSPLVYRLGVHLKENVDLGRFLRIFLFILKKRHKYQHHKSPSDPFQLGHQLSHIIEDLQVIQDEDDKKRHSARLAFSQNYRCINQISQSQASFNNEIKPEHLRTVVYG